MSSYEIGTAVGNVVGWTGVVLLIGLGVWFVGFMLYLTYLTIKEAPARRASKAMNARVDAIKAENRARVEESLRKQYGPGSAYYAKHGTAQVAAENDRKWYELTGRRD